MASPRRLRVLVLLHEELMPPEDLTGLPRKEIERIKCEYDVTQALEELGHEVKLLGLSDDLAPLRTAIDDWRPHVAFNLLDEFRGLAGYDKNVVSYLELKGVPYTGNNPRGLMLARDKALSKKILQYHRIRTPRFAVFPRGRKVRRPRDLAFPLIVKSLVEESSTGIAQASVVRTDEALAERVAFIHDTVETAAIAEQFVPGRELYASVVGNQRLEVFPIWELDFGELPAGSYRIATFKLKWDVGYQKKHGIEIGAAVELDPGLAGRIARVSKRIYRLLDLSGYARLDFRLDPEGELYLLEANPNPDLSRDEELASAAKAAGTEYEALIAKLVGLARRREVGF